MRLISDSELTRRSDAELAVLFQKAAQALATTKLDTPERRNAVASLQNIGRERARRHRQPRPPGL